MRWQGSEAPPRPQGQRRRKDLMSQEALEKDNKRLKEELKETRARLLEVAHVAAGGRHICALMTDGELNITPAGYR